MHAFGDPAETDILNRIHRFIPPDRCISIRFTSQVPPARSLHLADQWQRFKSIVHCQPMYDAFGTMYGAPPDPPDIYFATQYATIGVFANLLDAGGSWAAFLEEGEDALEVATRIIGHIAYSGCHGLECYYLDTPWSDWFIGEYQSDTTFLLGRASAWWLLAYTDTE